MIQNSKFLSRDGDGVTGICLCTHFSEFHFSEFSAAIFPSFDQWARCAVSRKKSKWSIHLWPLLIFLSSPQQLFQNLLRFHKARTPQPKARGGSSHMDMDKAFDKRVRVTEKRKQFSIGRGQDCLIHYLENGLRINLVLKKLHRMLWCARG